jgi:hypothetical protein
LFAAFSHGDTLRWNDEPSPFRFNGELAMRNMLAVTLALFFGLSASGQQGDSTVVIEEVKLRRDARGGQEAVITLKEPLPEGLHKGKLRVLFVIDGAGLRPKSVTDMPAAGSIGMRAGNGWSVSGGSLTHRGKPAGFVVDVGPLQKWPMADEKTITVPLDVDTLFPGMPARLEQQKGEVFVGFVENGKDGKAKVAVSNTASVKVSPKDATPRKKK